MAYLRVGRQIRGIAELPLPPAPHVFKSRRCYFVERWRKSGYDGHPSFFELTMMMAFDCFARNHVDYAVIEVGMGGRLDSTNIITPIACTITNISPDHMQFLGDTLPKIAAEKAGIIKSGIPVVIGEAEGEVRKVFLFIINKVAINW